MTDDSNRPHLFFLLSFSFGLNAQIRKSLNIQIRSDDINLILMLILTLFTVNSRILFRSDYDSQNLQPVLRFVCLLPFHSVN